MSAPVHDDVPETGPGPTDRLAGHGLSAGSWSVARPGCRRQPDDGHRHQQNQHHHQHHHHGGIPPDVVRSLVRGNDSADELDGYLMEKADAYPNSLSISVKLVDSAVVEKVRNLSSQMLVNILPTGLLETGNENRQSLRNPLIYLHPLSSLMFRL
ncbi:unnamed protein product [Macrosiphum euphorbiae]|uniref:Uncharacterized protein n=1 Tax=Macrosiphum euphorbiae TaxID=13131 RepID=A0AAV0Y501_9HEMI|nr:unnamed protein product [Macrosiphum euphorbiae]